MSSCAVAAVIVGVSVGGSEYEHSSLVYEIGYPVETSSTNVQEGEHVFKAL
jgi:hypothetical protein